MSLFGALRMRLLLASAMLLIVSACAVAVAATAAGAAVPPAPLQITTTSLPGATPGQPYTVQLQATGGTQPYTWSLTRTDLYPLPPDLSLNYSTGLISGTAGSPPVNLATTYSVYVNVMDATDTIVGTGFSIVLTPAGLVTPPAPLQITTASIPDASFNTGYSLQMQATGGTTPYYWSASNLPQGFTMSQSGVLSGSNPLPEQATITGYLYDSGFGYSNSYGVNSTVPGQQHTQQNYMFTVTSGYPQLDPTFFQLSAGLAPYSPYPIVNEIEAAVASLDAELPGLILTTLNQVLGEISLIVGQNDCTAWYALGLGGHCPLPGGV
jgi:hypothetical protein